MFKMTAQVEYAYIALCRLAEHPQCKLSDIAGGLSEKFMLQALTELRRAGLVESRRGKNGGYALALPASQITLADLLLTFSGGGSGSFDIAGKQSALSVWWQSALHDLATMAKEMSLASAIAHDAQAREQKRAMYYI